MPVHEVTVSESDSGELASTGAAARSKTPSLGLVVALFVPGLALLYVSLVTMGDVTAGAKMMVVLIALALLFRGVDVFLKATLSPTTDTGLMLSGVWLVCLIVSAVLADFLPFGEHIDISKTILDPGNARPDLFSGHPLGTNNLSLDLLARSVYAARISLLTATFAVTMSVLIGGTIGVCAGYYRGWFDRVVGVITDSSLAFPALLLLIAIAAILGVPKSPGSAIVKEGVALAFVGIPTMIRLSRANTLGFVQREFVLASRAVGASHRRTIFREIVPNVMLPVLSYSFIVIAVLIIAEGSLAFLGLGLQPPTPSWGNMIAEGDLATIRSHPHVPIVPGMFMFLTVFAFNRVGERARTLWDPRNN